MTIQQLKLGDSASHSKTISETDVYLFAGITGDLNPAHVNESVASASRVRRTDCPRHPQRRPHFRRPGHAAARPRHHLPGPGAEVHQARPLRGHRHRPPAQ